MKPEQLAAIDHVPVGAPNRELLAALLTGVENALAQVEADAEARDWHSRIHRVASLLRIAESAPKGTLESYKAYGALKTALDTTRKHATRHKLKPDTARGVLAEARLVLEAIR
jgi:hypothetical protein